ncbi:MAG: EamA family transporter [Candidatus Saccharibacteria bacterium]|nr:EamA family transporter [Candidatus Saccharibacteria bacterium]
MLWVLLPVVAAIFYGIGSYVENHVVDNEFQRKKAGAFILSRIPIFCISLIVLLLIFGRSVFMVTPMDALGLMLAGAINVIGSVYYLKALREGDTVDITIFSQVGPLISLGLGVVMLNEKINSSQSLGFLFIMAGACVVALMSDGKKKHTPDFRVAGITLISIFFSMLSDVVYVYFLNRGGTTNLVLFGQTFFFFQIGSLVAMIVAAVLFEGWRSALGKVFIHGKKKKANYGLAMIENITWGIADSLAKLGLILTPVVALFSAVGRASGLFVSLFITFAVSKMFPRLIRIKKMSKQAVFRYMLSAILIVVGIIVMV